MDTPKIWTTRGFLLVLSRYAEREALGARVRASTEGRATARPERFRQAS